MTNLEEKKVNKVKAKSTVKTDEKPVKTKQPTSNMQLKAVKEKEKISASNSVKKSSAEYKQQGAIYATGRRKSSAARVFCQKTEDKINITINDKGIKEYFSIPFYNNAVIAALSYLNIDSGYRFYVTVKGGGITGQVDAIKLGIAKCLALVNEEYKLILRKNGFLTRDSRAVESKKAGYRKARKKEQFSKR